MKYRNILNNQNGFGLLAAVFVVVIVAMFGALLIRYTQSGAAASAEDYLWAQALYTAESAAQLQILDNDGGGPGGPWPGAGGGDEARAAAGIGIMLLSSSASSSSSSSS